MLLLEWKLFRAINKKSFWVYKGILTPSVWPPFNIETGFKLVEFHTIIWGDFPTCPVATWILSGCNVKLKF